MGEKGLDVVSAKQHGGLAGFHSSPEAIRNREFPCRLSKNYFIVHDWAWFVRLL